MERRIDPKCAVKLCVAFEGYFKKTNGGAKIYCKGRDLEWVVDKDEYSVLDLTDDLAKHYEWGMTQMRSMWYLDSQSGIYASLTSDLQLLELLDNCSANKVVWLRATVVDCMPPHSTPQPNDATQPSQPMLSSKNDASQPTILSQPDDMEFRREEHVENSDDDDDSQEVYSNKSYQVVSESDTDHECTPNEVEEQQMDEWVESDYKETIHSYDIEKPCIEEGSLFANIGDFRKVIRQHAILNEYEFIIEKTDKKRFRACCADAECKWKIHGSVLQNGTKLGDARSQ